MVNDARSLSYRKVLAVLVAAVLTAGYLVFTGGGSSSVQNASAPLPVKQLSVDDLLLAAASAKGITMNYAGITPTTGGDIPILSFQFGTSRQIGSPAVGGRPVGDPSVSEAAVTKVLDKYSTKLLLASLNGSPAAVKLIFTDMSGPGGTLFDYMRVDLTDVLISSYTQSSGGELPSESLSLNFTTMKFTTHIPAGTSQIMTWNLAGPS